MTFRTSIVDGAQDACKKVPGFVVSLPLSTRFKRSEGGGKPRKMSLGWRSR